MLAIIGWIIVGWIIFVIFWNVMIFLFSLGDGNYEEYQKKLDKREKKLKRLNITEEELKKRERNNGLIFMFLFTVTLICLIFIIAIG